MNYCPNCGNKRKKDEEKCLNCDEVLVNETSRKLAKTAVIFGYLSFYPLVIFGSIVGFILGVISMSREDKYSVKGKKAMLLSIGSFFFWMMIVIILIGYVIIIRDYK